MTNDIMQPASILALFETNKDQRELFAQSIIADAIDHGNRNPLEMHIQLKCMEDIIKRITSDERFKAECLDIASMYEAKTFESHNAKVTIKEAGVTYDYSQCNDATLDEMEAKAEVLAEQIKGRKKLLQTIPTTGMADPETGCILYRAAKKSTTSISVTLK